MIIYCLPQKCTRYWIIRTMDIPLDTILETERLRFRAINHSDIDMVWSASRYKGFNDGMTWSAPANRDEILVTNDNLLQGWRSGKYYVFTVEIKDSQSPIGRVGIHAEDRPQIHNIGFWIHPEYSGKGYATEAASAIVNFGSERLGATLFTASRATWNDASGRVLGKLGFVFVRKDDQGFIKDGVAVAEYQYELRVEL